MRVLFWSVCMSVCLYMYNPCCPVLIHRLPLLFFFLSCRRTTSSSWVASHPMRPNVLPVLKTGRRTFHAHPQSTLLPSRSEGSSIVHPLLRSIAVPSSNFQTENGFSPPLVTRASTTSSPPTMTSPQMRSARSLSLPARDRNRCSSRARREGGSLRLGERGPLVSWEELRSRFFGV